MVIIDLSPHIQELRMTFRPGVYSCVMLVAWLAAPFALAVERLRDADLPDRSVDLDDRLHVYESRDLVMHRPGQ